MNHKQLIILILACLAVSFTAANATASEERIAKEDFTKFVDNFEAPAGEDYLPSLYNALVKEYPQYDWDLWELYVSGYPSAENSKGFKSVYVNEKGQTVTPACGVNTEPVKSHKVIDENTDGKEEVKDEEVKEDVDEKEEDIQDEDEEEIEESEHTYENLGKALDDYEGKLTCASKSCAKSLSGYLDEKGWDTEVIKKTFKTIDSKKKMYCVQVNTEDEGDVYIILG